MKSYLVALLIQAVSLGIGFGLSYLIDITKLLGEYNAHGMGLKNLFWMVMIFGVIGALINIYLYWTKMVIVIFSVAIIIALIAVLY